MNTKSLVLAGTLWLGVAISMKAATPSNSTWPQPYSVKQDKAAAALVLRTPYYAIEHDLKKGGTVSRITLTHGKAANLLVRPVATLVRDEDGILWSDVKDVAPQVTHRRAGLSEIVTVECRLMDEQGRVSGLRLKSTFEYRWGYVKIHKEFLASVGGFRVREVCPFTTVLAPSLSDYGYREGTTETEGAPPFSFGSNRWRKLRLNHPADQPLQIRFVPRSIIFADPGVEGLEWFVGSDLAQWDLQLAGRRGQARCSLEPCQESPGLALSVAPWWSTIA